MNDRILANFSVILIVALIAFGLSNSFALFTADIFGDLNLDILNLNKNSNNQLSTHDESSINYNNQKTTNEKKSSDDTVHYSKSDYTNNGTTDTDNNANNDSDGDI